MKAINPATGELVQEYDELSETDTLKALERASTAFETCRRTPIAERARLMVAAAGVLHADKARFARVMTLEMGKPIRAAEEEVEKCAWACEYYAEHAPSLLAATPVASDASESFVRFDPLGPVLAIMPWNFPFWQVFRFAAPALMAGNVGLLKHASNVPGCALAIQEVFERAGFPAHAFTSLLVPSQAIERCIAHPAVRAVTLTGSEAAGKSVAAIAGRHLKKTVLELGGSDPFIVLADADVEVVAAQAARARTINSGQSCIAAKRFIVEADIFNAFTERFVAHMAGLKVGDPMQRETDVGPLARADLVSDLHEQVVDSCRAGAELRLGGERLARTGFFYAPTVLSRVEPGMRAFDEETFGPVAALIRAEDPEHAVELANRSRFGLGASIWTADRALGKRLAARIEAGVVFINDIVKSDPRLPFGGVKASGFGRELGSFGIQEFVNIKTVWVA